MADPSGPMRTLTLIQNTADHYRRHRLICIVLSLCKHACESVCDVHPGIDPYPLLARSCNRWWPDFVTFTACKKTRFGLKRGKKAQCVSNRCKDSFERKNYFGVTCTLMYKWYRYIVREPRSTREIGNYNFLMYVWVPEVGNTADTPNPPWVLPL